MNGAPVEGSVDLAWLVKGEPWQLCMAAAMLRPYFPATAAVLESRAARQEPGDRASQETTH